MTDDIHAAAERWRRYVEAVEPLPVGWDKMGDACLLATHYLALLDDTPIDEEWGSKEIQHIHGRLLERSAYGWYIEFGHMKAHIQTRGQLRALLLAMGVGHGPQD